METGFAVTLAPVDELNEADGLHKYVFAPLAESNMFCPAQIFVDGETLIVGRGFTVTVTCAVAVQPFKFPVTV